MSLLTFKVLEKANTERQKDYPSCEHWDLSHWSNATLGELGEAANLIKKIDRGDFTVEEIRSELEDELADVAIYLQILAEKAGIDLGKAIIKKFNDTSTSIGSKVYITNHGYDCTEHDDDGRS